jgi:hemerythrin-like domain-containing protein
VIQIGAPLLRDFGNPLGVLSDCHRRVERFLGVMVQVAQQARGGVLKSEEHAALEGALRYFREAAPKHTADEEQSLFPRLRRCEDAAVARVLHVIDGLEADHRTVIPDHAQVDQLGTVWLAAGRASVASTQLLRDALSRLERLYRRHIAIEDTEIFPTAARVLDAASLRAVGVEMAARRGIPWPAASGGPQA